MSAPNGWDRIEGDDEERPGFYAGPTGYMRPSRELGIPQCLGCGSYVSIPEGSNACVACLPTGSKIALGVKMYRDDRRSLQFDRRVNLLQRAEWDARRIRMAQYEEHEAKRRAVLEAADSLETWFKRAGWSALAVAVVGVLALVMSLRGC